MPALHLATFACDVTPPSGHPLCGGWIEPVRAVDDPLEARGVVLLGMGQPVVLCAVDWCELRNDSHERWRAALAEAAHTVPDHVAVNCIHQHDAPMADLGAQRLLDKVPGAPANLDPAFHELAATRTAAALHESLARTAPFDAIGIGRARVDKVASNRRILGPSGKVEIIRYSATKDPKARAAPEGLIDPWLRTLSFWRGDKPLAALSYYATHPMSHYGNGRVSADFCGLARRQRQAEEPPVFQVYFTGCAGNITAGKYNDGSDPNRFVLRDRIHDAMVAAWNATERRPVAGWTWRVEPVKLPPRTEDTFSAPASRKLLENAAAGATARGNAAIQLAWLERIDRPIDLTCIDFGPAAVLHLPGEPFIEYQLRAQAQRPESFVCVAGYGDGGPGYIPVAKSYAEGGYEPTVALAGPDSEAIVNQAIARLLRGDR
jgi:hypothetical protein